MSQSLFQSGAKLFQIGANCYLQVGQTVISKWSNYFKVGQKLFQIGAIISEWDITLIKRKTINPVKANKEAFLELFLIKVLLKTFRKIQRKTRVQSLLFNKVSCLPASLLKRRLRHSCFSMNLQNLQKHFFLEHLYGD